jgi:proteasome lid subunit RPN8/RPN11
MLILSSKAIEQITAHSESTYPDECVGLLLGYIEEPYQGDNDWDEDDDWDDEDDDWGDEDDDWGDEDDDDWDDDDEIEKVVVQAYPVENQWEGQVQLTEGKDGEKKDTESRHERFYLDPRDYLRVEREGRSRGLDIVGCYHSHPDHSPSPSERDKVGAQGVGGGKAFSFVIQSVRQGNVDEMASWLLLDNGTRFVQEELLTEIEDDSDNEIPENGLMMEDE